MIGAQRTTDIFPLELARGHHDLENHTIKFALFSNMSGIDRTTTDYTTTDEASGNGYVAGGFTLTVSLSQIDEGDAKVTVVSADDVQLADLSLTGAVHGGLIYNSSLASNNAMCIINFGQDITFDGEVTFEFASANINLMELRTG